MRTPVPSRYANPGKGARRSVTAVTVWANCDTRHPVEGEPPEGAAQQKGYALKNGHIAMDHLGCYAIQKDADHEGASPMIPVPFQGNT